MATLVSRCIAKSQDGGVPEKKEVQKEEGVTLCYSRLHLSCTEAKSSLHRVRGIVCRTHTCGLRYLTTLVTQPYAMAIHTTTQTLVSL